jgi:hypothetical protein
MSKFISLCIAFILAVTINPAIAKNKKPKPSNNPTLSKPSELDAIPSEPINEEKRAVKLFKEKAEKIMTFFNSKPVSLDKQDFSNSQTGVVYTHYRFNMLDININVRKSDSLISPFIGYINLIYTTDENKECGDITSEKTQYSEIVHWGYSTYEKAISHTNDCFRPHSVGTQIFPPANTQLTFAYQDGHWVFKDAIRTKYDKRDRILLGALGRPEPGQYKLADNQKWENLIK